MILSYLANAVEKTFEFSQQERKSNKRGTLDHPRIHTHTNKNIQRNKQNKKNRTQDFFALQ